jgi:hypothetical protein
MVKLETIELKDAKIVLKTTPSSSLHWKEKPPPARWLLRKPLASKPKAESKGRLRFQPP